MRFSQLRSAFLLPALAGAVAVVPLLWFGLQGLLEQSAVSHLARAVQPISRVLADRVEDPPERLQAFVRGLSGLGGLRVTVIAPDGKVLADSERTWAQVEAMDNHGTRPEILDALDGGKGSAVRRSATLRENFVYVAQQMSTRDGGFVVLRVSEPMAELAALRGRMARILALSLLAAVLAAGLVSLWLDHKLWRPLEDLVTGANRMALGELGYRNPVPDLDELAALARSLNRLGERVQEQMAAAEAERSHLQTVGASMSEGVLVTDREGRALMANPSFRKLLRLRGEVAGKTPLEATRSPRLDELVRETIASGTSHEVELEAPSGKPVAVSITPLTDRSGVVVAVRDISELTALAEIRRDLVANVSHELKTPLAAIRGYAETLHDGALDDAEASKRFVHRILEQCRRLQALLEDLLTLSRLERRDEESERVPTDLGEVLNRAAEVMEPIARERQVALQLDLAPVPRFEADAEGLEKLCLNLLDNAVKYNRPGGEVRVRLRRRGGEAVLEVEDSGRGIPEAALPRLFERFYRVDRGRSRDEGGTGLGLAIVKHAAQRHGGSVEVVSKLGEGSTFTVRLPLE
ncbi:MAG: ATP-binding protein [Thermoanaerobaculia bacterium]